MSTPVITRRDANLRMSSPINHRALFLRVVLARKSVPAPWRIVRWNGEQLSDWQSKLENCDVIINLAGGSVNCRYTAANRKGAER
jgi:NAD dependent epimerase/dehydratase family enzyme